MRSAAKIQAWRDANPGKRITEQDLLQILGVGSLLRANLEGADLAGTNLRGAYLYGANLAEADLTDADLQGVRLYGANLAGANLRGANLTDASLRGADLTDADLTGANLGNANMRDAHLWDADLWGADLTGANLTGANLAHSTGGVAQIDNIYPYPATLQPTPDGWHARVGCWYGTLYDLHAIATSDDDGDWPEARGVEREQRRPLLQAILTVFDAHVISHPGVIDQLNRQWGDQK